MTDQPFREIQLSGKQLFFLFMASVVLAVAIFLFGVSVGRGVRSATGTTVEVASPPDTGAPSPMPAATEPKPGDLAYHDTLQGPAGATPRADEPPPSPANDQPAASAAASRGGTGASTPAPAPAPAAGAAGKTPSAPPDTTKTQPPPKPQPERAAKTGPPPPAPGSWLIQTGAFGSKPNADKMAADLRGKGFAAYVDSQGPTLSKYRVRVGPFPSRPEAEQAASKLKQQGVAASLLR